MTRRDDPVSLVGSPVVERLRASGFVVVPVVPTDVAVGEVMACTGCADPQMAWEALNCALNWMGIEEPSNASGLASLGRGDTTLAAWRNKVETETPVGPPHVLFRLANALDVPVVRLAPDGVADPVLAEAMGILRRRIGLAEACSWFGAPSPALGGKRPVDVFEETPSGLVAAALSRISGLPVFKEN
jgi:hypothetical protein